MRRLPRILLNVATVLSLLACAAVVWIRLYGSIGTSWCYVTFRWNCLEVSINGADFFIPQDWLLIVIVVLLGLHYFARMRRERRPEGLCTTCGYDLRATPDRCPECGTIPTP